MTHAPTSRGDSTEWARLGSAVEMALPCGLFLVAATIRFLYLTEASSGPFFESGGVDSTAYLQRAFEGLGSRWPGEFAFDQPPLYPLWLATIGAIFGESIWTIKSVQVVLGSLTCVWVYFIGRRSFRDARVGIAAGLICAFHGTLIYFDGQIVSANLELFLVTSALLALLRASDGDSARWWLVAGLLIGLSSINRGAILFTLPWLLWWMFRIEAWRPTVSTEERPQGRAGIRRAALVCVPVAACIFPVTLHNFHHDVSRSAPRVADDATADSEPQSAFERILARDFVFITSRVAMNLHLGNVPDRYETNDPNHPDCFQHTNHVMRLPYRTNGERSASGQQRVLFAETRREIAEAPGAWVWLTGRKWFELVNAVEIPRNANLYAERELSSVLWLLLWPGPIAFPGALFFPLALLGLALDRHAWRERFPPFAFVLPRALFVVAFFVAARLRLPLIPVLSLFAAYAAVWLFDRVRAWEPTRLAAPLAAAAALLVATNLPLSQPQTAFGAYEFINHADHLARQGANAVAIAHYRKAVELAPDSATAHFKLGLGLDGAGRHREAVENPRGDAAHRSTLRRGRDSPGAHPPARGTDPRSEARLRPRARGRRRQRGASRPARAPRRQLALRRRRALSRPPGAFSRRRTSPGRSSRARR